MDDDRLFGLDSIPEVPLFRESHRRVQAARGIALDARFANDYPPEWHKCPRCGGRGSGAVVSGVYYPQIGGTCPNCLGMGSLKGRVRLEAGHRCERCLHPYMPKGDAKMLGVQPTPYHWSPCDERCTHTGPRRYLDQGEWVELALSGYQSSWVIPDAATVEAEWRILTVHHLDGDKANCRWWNLAALCQRCHLEIQAKVVLERVYPHEHSEWFKPHAAGWYAFAYNGEELSRDETLARLDELLALELTPA